MRWDSPTALYRLFSAPGVLEYVGISGRIDNRLYTHLHDDRIWHDPSLTTVEWMMTRPAAEHAEREAIRREWPAYNVCKQDWVAVGMKVFEQHPDVADADLPAEALRALVQSRFDVSIEHHITLSDMAFALLRQGVHLDRERERLVRMRRAATSLQRACDELLGVQDDPFFGPNARWVESLTSEIAHLAPMVVKTALVGELTSASPLARAKADLPDF